MINQDKNRDKQIYNNKICISCKNKDNCDKNKFNTFIFKDRISIRCEEYEYDI